MTASTSSCGIRTAVCTITDRAEFLSSLRRIAEAYGTKIICFAASRTAGRAHVALAIKLASRAFEEGANISNNLEMESLLYAAGTRQCNVASDFGIREGENHLFVACVPEKEGVWSDLGFLFHFVDEDWDTIGSDKRSDLIGIFSISPEEVAAAGGADRVADLVMERVVLLQVIR